MFSSFRHHRRDGAARPARAAIFVSVIYFTVLDAIGHIGIDRTMLAVRESTANAKLEPNRLTDIELLLDTLWADLVIGVGSFVSETASRVAAGWKRLRSQRNGTVAEAV